MNMMMSSLFCALTKTGTSSRDYSKTQRTTTTRNLAGANLQPYADIVFPNGDGSSTRFVLKPTTNLNQPLKSVNTGVGTGSHDVIRKWNRDAVTTTGSKSNIINNENWRIDQQGTHRNGPDGKSQPGVTWANLQLQYGGTSTDSRNEANKLRSRGQGAKSTSVAEVNAPVGVKFSAKAFQRAFAESMSNARDGGVQIWMYRVEKSG